MNYSIRGLKENARLKLDGHWHEAVGYSVILSAIGLIAALIVSQYAGAVTTYAIGSGLAVAFLLRLLAFLFVCGALLHFLGIERNTDVTTGIDGVPRDRWGRPTVSPPGGESPWNADVPDVQPRQEGRAGKSVYSDILAAFRMQPDRFIIYGLITGAVDFIPDIPLVAALASPQASAEMWLFCVCTFAGLFVLCAYFRLTWAMAPLILLDCEARISVDKAMKESGRMMKGKKRKLLLLVLSFIGWFFLAVFTLGLGLLWIIPYAAVSWCGFYEAVRVK